MRFAEECRTVATVEQPVALVEASETQLVANLAPVETFSGRTRVRMGRHVSQPAFGNGSSQPRSKTAGMVSQPPRPTTRLLRLIERLTARSRSRSWNSYSRKRPRRSM